MKKIFNKTSSNIFKLIVEAIQDPTSEEMREYLVSQYGSYEENQLDIEAAIYWFASLNYNDQWSNLYSALSTSEYSPGAIEKAPVPGGDVEYTYSLYNIKYETNELQKTSDLTKSKNYFTTTSNGNFSGDGGNNNNDDGDDDGDQYIFRIRKSDLEYDQDEIDEQHLQQKMKSFLETITRKNVASFSYDLENTRQIEETTVDMMYQSLVDKYAK